MPQIDWKVAAVGGALAGVGLGGFVAASRGEPFPELRDVELREQEVDDELASPSAPVVVPFQNDDSSPADPTTTLASPPVTAVASPDSPAAPVPIAPPPVAADAALESPPSVSVPAPAPAPVVASPDSPAEPPAPAPVASPDSPASPPTPAGPDSPDSD